MFHWFTFGWSMLLLVMSAVISFDSIEMPEAKAPFGMVGWVLLCAGMVGVLSAISVMRLQQRVRELERRLPRDAGPNPTPSTGITRKSSFRA